MTDQVAENKDPKKSTKSALSGNAIFMISVGSVASVVGFAYTYMQAKRNEIKDITSQNTPQEVRERVVLLKDGTRMASRALAYSWLCSISGVALLSYAAWKISGAKDLDDFKQKAGGSLPVIPKPEEQGRSNFESLKDLANYLEAEDLRKKNVSTEGSK